MEELVSVALVGASPAVLAAVKASQKLMSPGNTARTRAFHDQTYTSMLRALRPDLSGRKGSHFTFYMISKRPLSGSTAPTEK